MILHIHTQKNCFFPGFIENMIMRTEIIISECVRGQRLEVASSKPRAIKGIKKLNANRNKYEVIKMKPFYFERICLMK